VQLLRDAGYGVYPGEASFVDANTVRVGDDAHRASGPDRDRRPHGGAADSGHRRRRLDRPHQRARADEVPESLLVVGGGPVGLEFAQIFARFGSRVTVVNHGPQIAARADADAASELQARSRTKASRSSSNAASTRVAADERVVGRTHVEVSHVLLAPAASRTSRSSARRDRRRARRGGIVVDGTSALRRRHLGRRRRRRRADVHADRAVPGAIAIEDMFATARARADYSSLPTAIFTDPELGAVGLTERRPSAGLRRRRRDASAARRDARQYYGESTASTRSSTTARAGACSACTSSRAARATSSGARGRARARRDRRRPRRACTTCTRASRRGSRPLPSRPPRSTQTSSRDSTKRISNALSLTGKRTTTPAAR
jgi:pyruvate/2-oxoglutarate dehydrogenase complex dihydrolipoamide dehydrogenase (E3) component